MIESISALRSRLSCFYRMLEFEMMAVEVLSIHELSGGNRNSISSRNLPQRKWSWWGRAIFYCSEALAPRCEKRTCRLPPRYARSRHAEWGERFFHLVADFLMRQLKFAWPLR